MPNVADNMAAAFAAAFPLPEEQNPKQQPAAAVEEQIDDDNESPRENEDNMEEEAVPVAQPGQRLQELRENFHVSVQMPSKAGAAFNKRQNHNERLIQYLFENEECHRYLNETFFRELEAIKTEPDSSAHSTLLASPGPDINDSAVVDTNSTQPSGAAVGLIPRNVDHFERGLVSTDAKDTALHISELTIEDSTDLARTVSAEGKAPIIKNDVLADQFEQMQVEQGGSDAVVTDKVTIADGQSAYFCGATGEESMGSRAEPLKHQPHKFDAQDVGKVKSLDQMSGLGDRTQAPSMQLTDDRLKKKIDSASNNSKESKMHTTFEDRLRSKLLDCRDNTRSLDTHPHLQSLASTSTPIGDRTHAPSMQLTDDRLKKKLHSASNNSKGSKMNTTFEDRLRSKLLDCRDNTCSLDTHRHLQSLASTSTPMGDRTHAPSIQITDDQLKKKIDSASNNSKGSKMNTTFEDRLQSKLLDCRDNTCSLDTHRHFRSPASTSKPSNTGDIKKQSNTTFQNNNEISPDDELGPSGDDGDGIITSSTKQKYSATSGDVEIGAVQVDKQAPQISSRFFQILSRPSARARSRQMNYQSRSLRQGSGVLVTQDEPMRANVENGNAQRTQGEQKSQLVNPPRSSINGSVGEHGELGVLREEDQEPQSRIQESMNRSRPPRVTFMRRVSHLVAHVSNANETLVSATLVEEDEGEVVVAERVGYFERKWKGFALCMCFFLVVMAVFIPISITKWVGEEPLMHTEVPSMQPSMQPSFDSSPTLQLVQTRGYVRCGLRQVKIEIGKGMELDLCRSVAAVVVGNPDKIELVPITFANRWKHLQDRAVDILVSPDTHTIEREVKESSTGAGFTFSNVWMYTGMAYFGNHTLVNCAEKEMRYDECTDLVICVEDSITHYDFLKTAFPPEYFKTGSSLKEKLKMLLNGTCNVIGHDRGELFNLASPNSTFDERNFTVGRNTFTKDPFGIVSRNTDREFSDIINWVLQALFYGEEHGLAKDPSLCKNSTKVTLHDVSDLDFMNAVHCVGNYGEIYDGEPKNRGMNQINNGTGMLYAIPFGNLDKDDAVGPSSTMTKIRNEGSLNCGVVVPDDFEGNVTESNKLTGMSVDYCRTLAAALFNGDSKDVNFLTFRESNNTSYIALANGEIDVVVGGRVQRKYDFASSPSLGGFHFSTPYYYGNEAVSNDVSSYSMTTREDDVLFASFVNCIVMSTIYAQENSIQSERSKEMPLVSVFGSSLRWALKDAIAYSGSYDQIYTKNFGSEASEVDRGRNTLNKGGPLLHSFPSLG